MFGHSTAAAEPYGSPEALAPASGASQLIEFHRVASENPPAEWLIPGADELFRGIYTRAWTGEREILAVESSIAGEGRTTVSVGVAVTIAQDFPACRVAIVETDPHGSVLPADFA